MQSITLQTNDAVIASGDILGRLQFAASAESDGGASRLVGPGIQGMAEGTYSSSSNPSSLLFLTSADDNQASKPRLKFSHEGHFLPISGSYNIGEPGNRFNNIYGTGLAGYSLELASNVPSDTTNKLYNDGGTLKFNGSTVGGAGGGGGLDNVVEDTTPQLGGNLDLNSYSVTGVGNINIDGTIEANYIYGDLDGPIVVECKNSTGSTISAGTPVYVSGYYGTNGKALIAPADAADSSKMPAIGLLETALSDDAEGYVHCFGLSIGMNTGSFGVGDTVYVASGGGLTKTRPAASNVLVQNIGRVLRSDTSQGRILVLGPGRTNDVPNSGHFEQLTVDEQTILAKDDGKVGIGTTNPGAFSSSFNQLVIGDGGGYKGATIYSATQGTLAFGDTATSTQDGYRGYLAYIHSNDYMVIGTSGAERIRIASDGKVGIGDASPNTKLHVAGAITTDSYIVFGDPSNGYIGGQVTDTLTYQGDSHRFWNEAKTTEYATFNTTSSVFNDGALDRDFRVEGYGDPNVLVVDASEDNVGIGTASPSYKLEVVDGNSKNGYSGATAYVEHTTNGYSGYAIKRANSTKWTLLNDYSDSDKFKINSGGYAGTTAVTVDSSLNVGIGTATPTKQLHTNGTTALIADGSTYELDISASAATLGGNRFQLLGTETVFNNAGANFDFRVEGDADTHLLFTDASSDKVGIGCSPSLGKLHLQALYTNNNGHDAIYIDQRNTSSSNGTYNNAGIDLLSRKLVNSGVSDTGQILGADLVATLDGDGSLNNSYGVRTWGGIYINNSGSLTNAWGIQPRVINGGYNGASITNAYGVDILIDGDLYDRIDGNSITTAMSLRIRGIEHAANKWAIYQEGVSDNNYFAGNVGVGAPSPSYKLEINGNIGLTSDGFYASPTGVMVGTNGWLYNDGQTTISHGSFSDNGDAQNSIYVLRGSTTDATFTTIQNNGSDVILASNRTMMFTANIVGRRTNGSDNAAYKLEGMLYNDGYGASIIGTPVKTTIGETDSSWDVQATITGAGAGGSDYLNIQVKGATSKDVNWVAKLELLEVGGDITSYTEANILDIDANIIP